MAQGDYLIQNQSFPSFRSDLNSTLEAINTSNSGTSRPSSAVAGTVWLDTTNATNPTLKFFDGTDDISLAQLDYTANTVNWLDSTVVFDIVGDTTPQLGGDLDVNGNDIVSVSNGNITFTPDGTGKVIIDGLSFPTADGTSGQALVTDGAGNLSFASVGSPSIDDNGDATAMTISSNENIGIGITDPDSYESSARELVVGNTSGATGVTVRGGTESNIYFADGTTGTEKYAGYMQYDHSSDKLNFGTNANTRMSIDSSGILKTNSTATQCAEFDRKSSDGNLIVFLRDAAVAGLISVSGGIVSYNSFTGTHWSRFTDNSKPTILKGTVLESLDEMCDWYNLEFNVTTQDDDGNDITTPQKIPHVLTDTQSNGDVITYNHEGTDYQATIVKEADIKHMKSKVSDTVDAKNVYGVFNSWDEDGEGYNDFYVASVGSFVVRIKANETIAKGDLLQSNGDGTAKVQTDDNVKSSSFAKVLSTTVIETYDDGSFIVPCSLMC